jgi:subfamily B ATP-binding cassette protein MsbA
MSQARDLFGQYRRLFTFVRPYRGRLAAGILCGALYGSTNGALLFIVQRVWSRILEQPTHDLTWWRIAGFALLLPLAMFVRGVCDYLGNYLMNWVGLRVVTDLRSRIFEQLQSLSLDFYTEARSGDLISRVTNDVGLIQRAITNVVEDIVKQPVTLLAVTGYLLYTDWKLTLGALVLFPVCLVPILGYGRKIRIASRRSQELQASALSVLHEAIGGARVVRAFGAERREVEEFRTVADRSFGQQMRVARSRAVLSPIMEVLAAAGVAGVFLYAFFAHLQASQLVSMALGFWFLYEPFKKLSRVYVTLQESLTGAERTFQILDERATVVETASARPLPRFHQSIRLENVTFRYAGTDRQPGRVVLEGINLEIHAGALVALVGASGSGKTTLLNLIPRFYDPAAGTVRVDGMDIREVTFKSLREQIGLVTQDTFLFNDTVANNISYGVPGATIEQVMSAAKRAHAHDFIRAMPQGYDTVTGESGVKLSGGQRQRLAIARAILHNPPILLLDEATSALDTESERAVQAALDDLMWGGGAATKEHTMLVIAHRLSTVQHADLIVVLDKGRIVEQGAHDELLARGQVYKRLYDLQFEL